MKAKHFLLNVVLCASVAAVMSLLTSAPVLATKTLVYCSEGGPDDLSPALARTNTSFDAQNPVFDNLVQYDSVTQQILPQLAESWTISDDELVYTFKLRAGVAFHTTDQFTPTRPLTAEDVLFSFYRQWRADHPYHNVGGKTYDDFNELSMPEVLKSIEAVDDLTVRFTLTRRQAPFVANLSVPFASITSAEYGAQMVRAGTPELFDQLPVGTGPFKMVSFRKGVMLRYQAFENHWGGRPPLDNLVFSITPNAAVRLNKVQAGECHVMPFPNVSDLTKIAADPSLKLIEQDAYNVAFIALNAQKAPFNDVRVRRAFNMAIDKNTLVEAVFGKTGRVAKNPLPPTSWGYNDAIVDYAYDPAGAAKLLAEAGYPQGFTIELTYMPVARPYMPNGKRAAEMMRHDLAKIGVHVNLATDEWSAYPKRLMYGRHEAGMIGWIGANSDPSNFLDLQLSCAGVREGGGNMAKWCNEEFDDLLSRATQTTDIAERTALYHQAQQVFKREAPWLPLAHSRVFVVQRQEVRGYQMSPFGLNLFRTADLAE